jgi:hypothetical protein
MVDRLVLLAVQENYGAVYRIDRSFRFRREQPPGQHSTILALFAVFLERRDDSLMICRSTACLSETSLWYSTPICVIPHSRLNTHARCSEAGPRSCAPRTGAPIALPRVRAFGMVSNLYCENHCGKMHYAANMVGYPPREPPASRDGQGLLGPTGVAHRRHD